MRILVLALVVVCCGPRAQRPGSEEIEAVQRMKDQKACDELRGALTAPSADVRGRAAQAFLESCGREAVNEDVAAALRESVRLGNAAPQALLLLGESNAQESRQLLRERSTGKQHLKWALDSQPVPESLVSAVARLKLDTDARAVVLQELKESTPAEARFFLDALEFLRDPEVAERALSLLDDQRKLPNEQRRRIADYAVPAFARVYQLQQLPFDVRDFGVYSDEQIAAVRAAVKKRLKAG